VPYFYPYLLLWAAVSALILFPVVLIGTVRHAAGPPRESFPMIAFIRAWITALRTAYAYTPRHRTTA
jgi:hypothetical protein